MEKFYNKDISEIYEYFNSSIDGLDNEQCATNKKKYGINKIKESKKKSTTRIFLEQFQDMLVIILIVSAIISIFLNELESTIVIFVVITINAILGTYQYQKAERTLNSLRNLSSPISYVIRNKQLVKIRSYELVCGDIVVINTGDIISADGRIIEEESLEINESSLTGESVPVKKNNKVLDKDIVEMSEQTNMLFSGTFCTKGRCKYIVCNVGMNTEIGKIAEKLNEIDQKRTPLQNGLDSFSKYLAIIIISVCLLVFFISLYKKADFLDSLMFSVALAVAAIPEALSTIVTIVLALGTEKMAKENAIIKDLKAVETLGCISVICSDKTGTLTTNEMAVMEFESELPIENFKKQILLSTNYDSYKIQNNPTENALINFSKDYKNIKACKLQEIAFTSDRKIMSNLYNIGNENYLFVKGGVDVVLSKCKYIYSKEVRLINKEDIMKINSIVNNYASKGRRIISFAYKKIYRDKVIENDESDLIFTGFVTLIDPPRKESKEAVNKCIKAGIKPIMLTGDYKNTAIAIASDIGIYKEGDIAVTGNELDELTQQQLEDKISNISVYARLNPKQKIRIVEAWQSKSKVVAMTGDGVNDALALAKSDVSISMGNGTEVAKDASSMILVDNNFDTIVKSIVNGRKIYINIQNAIRFLISGNFAAILIVLFTTFLDLPIPFLPVHLLFINLLTDSLPAIAIGMQEDQGDLLSNKPRNKKESILNKKLIGNILLEGILIFACCCYGYMDGLKHNIACARTMAFSILCLSRLFHSLNCATKDSVLVVKKINKFLIGSLFVGVLLINLVLFIPELKSIFVISQLDIEMFFKIYGLSIIPLVVVQMFKLYK